MASNYSFSAAGLMPQLTAGDALLIYDAKPTALHELIQARERATCGDTAWAELTHVAVVVGSGKEDAEILEMLSAGCCRNQAGKYKNTQFWVLHPPDYATPEQIALCIRKWEEQEGIAHYDFIGFLGEFFAAWDMPLTLSGTAHRFICSALYCFGALAYEVQFPISYAEMTPADVAAYRKLPIQAPVEPLSFFGRFLNSVAVTGALVGRLFSKVYR